MAAKLPTSQTRNVRHASGCPLYRSHKPTRTAPASASASAPAMTAPTSRGDAKRNGVDEILAATRPPATVTRTSMIAYPNESTSDDPTSGSKISAPRKAPTRTGV